MSSFHDQIFSEIDSARKLAAQFANRHGRKPAGEPRTKSGVKRLAQERAAAAEIAALAVEEERLTGQARERAELRAKAREEEIAKTVEVREVALGPEPVKSRWNAMEILKGLAKLRVKERFAAEELLRKAHEVWREKMSKPGNLEPSGQGIALKPPATSVRGMWTPVLGAHQVWYFTSSGTRCGPVTFAELRTMATSRVLDPRLDMVWKKGMAGWKPAGLLDGLFERRTVPAETPDRHGTKRLRVVAALPTDLTAALASKQMRWPGVGRRFLWLGLLLIPILWSQIVWWSTPTWVAAFGSPAMSKILPFATLVPVAALIYLVLMRLVNLGMSRWWALVLAIPVLNLWVGARCLIFPSGFAHHRKIDRPGMAAAIAVIMLVPATWYFHSKHPEWRSQAYLHTMVHRLVEKAAKVISTH